MDKNVSSKAIFHFKFQKVLGKQKLLVTADVI